MFVSRMRWQNGGVVSSLWWQDGGVVVVVSRCAASATYTQLRGASPNNSLMQRASLAGHQFYPIMANVEGTLVGTRWEGCAYTGNMPASLPVSVVGLNSPAWLIGYSTV